VWCVCVVQCVVCVCVVPHNTATLYETRARRRRAARLAEKEMVIYRLCAVTGDAQITIAHACYRRSGDGYVMVIAQERAERRQQDVEYVAAGRRSSCGGRGRPVRVRWQSACRRLREMKIMSRCEADNSASGRGAGAVMMLMLAVTARRA